jgi:peptidoglycan hydrolase CwlO-like protein
MQRKTLSIVLVLLLSLLLEGCVTIKDFDFPACVEITPDRAWCTHTISDKEYFWDETHKVNGQTYWEQRPSMVLLPLESWKQLKKSAIKFCKQNQKQCEKEIGSWDRKINNIDSKLQK